ncbi:MAG: HEAT repeat domain-containing protein [Candidatus Aegiribacteria sp.]
MKRSFGTFTWIGDEKPPFTWLKAPDDCSPDCVDAALVSGRGDPGRASETVRKRFGNAIPWAAYCHEEDFHLWLNAGAYAFIVPGASSESASASLNGIRRLSETASSRNPLSGLPGNQPIASRLRSHVLDGDCMAAYFDISGFKPFNDYYGFSRGDAVLRSLSSILTENLSGHFVGHVGGDDFVAVGRGEEFLDSVQRVTRIFNGRAGGFYSGGDLAAGGIEALDRTGSFRFYPLMDLTVSVVDGSGCATVDDLARKAGLEKKRVKGEIMPDTVSSFLAGESGEPEYGDFRRWVDGSSPDANQIKALLESAGILGDTGMPRCLAEILRLESDYRIRKSAARALGSIAGDSSVEALRRAVRDGNVHVRTAATMALPFILGAEAGPLLSRAVRDGSTWVRRAALRGLGVSGWRGAAEILSRELERAGEGRYWLDHRQELTAALEGASFLGDPTLSDRVAEVLLHNPGIRKSLIWKALLTLGGRTCFREILRAFRTGAYHDCVENLGSFDPGCLSPAEQEELESVLVSVKPRRRADRIHILEFLGRLTAAPSETVSGMLLDRIASTGEPAEFETLVDTLQARGVAPRACDLARIVDNIGRGKLKLARKAIVSMLRWASTGKYSISRAYLEKLLRHDSREVRTAAARAVIALARKERKTGDNPK